MRDSTDAFLDRSLSPLQRVQLIWKCVFFLRVWRQWLLRERYSIKENFITLNAYHCIELNAHVLIQLLRYLKNAGKPVSSFTPWNFGSQPCEAFFRKSRSLTSTNHTAVNFSVLDFLHRCKRIDLLSEVPAKLKSNYSFTAPKRVMKQQSVFVPFERFPTDGEILDAVDHGRRAAWEMAVNLKMDMPAYAANAFIDFSDPAYEGFLWTEDDARVRDEAEDAAREHEQQGEQAEQPREQQDLETDEARGSVLSRGLMPLTTLC